MAKIIVVTGGVVSSLGKGIAAASLGLLLKARGLRVTIQKLDPYLNIDPGTMNDHRVARNPMEGWKCSMSIRMLGAFLRKPYQR